MTDGDTDTDLKPTALLRKAKTDYYRGDRACRYTLKGMIVSGDRKVTPQQKIEGGGNYGFYLKEKDIEQMHVNPGPSGQLTFKDGNNLKCAGVLRLWKQVIYFVEDSKYKMVRARSITHGWEREIREEFDKIVYV